MGWLILFSLFVWYFWNSLDSKNRALALIKDHCSKLNIQILDEAVVLSKTKLQRDIYGKIKIKRHFDFEFTSFDERRYKGKLILLGHTLQNITVEPHLIDISE